MEDRKLTYDEILELLKAVVSSNGSLKEIKDAIAKIEKSEITVQNENNVLKTDIKDIDVASIYSKNALPFVKEDLKNHPTTDTKQVINDFAPETEETKEGPVLKKALVPNPWGESGAKHVTPGENLDY